MGLEQFYPSPTHPYRFELHRDFEFSAAHFIPHESAGRCQNVHGHNYKVDLTIVGDTLDECGFLVNFSGLKRHVHDLYDHKLLNDEGFDEGFPPSTELVAQRIHHLVREYLRQSCGERKVVCRQVILRETSGSYIIFRP